ncbi:MULTISPECIES: hypothetical protein [unclassified Rhodococcus (in: high G+C Gram-positive bacteria)]|nr:MULTISPECIES: hypothetical protein [unclassified Rhodococcus (in: high G+C Gram-positive bacteria)]
MAAPLDHDGACHHALEGEITAIYNGDTPIDFALLSNLATDDLV